MPITFYLSKRNGTGGTMVQQNPQEESKLYPTNKGVPSIDLIVDPRPARKGKTMIRYIKGENSIFVDEQTTPPPNKEKIRSGLETYEPIYLEEGRVVVEDSDEILAEYLRHTNYCKDFAKALKRPWTYFEYKPQLVAKKSLDKVVKYGNNIQEVIKMSYGKQKALVRVANLISSTTQIEESDPSIITATLFHNLQNPKFDFDMYMNNDYIETEYLIHTAIEKGHILWRQTNPYDLVWKSGGAILNVPVGTEDKVRYTAVYLQDKAPDVMQVLRKICGFDEVKTETKSENQEILDWLATSPTKEEIIDKMLEWNKASKEKIFVMDGSYYKFEEFVLKTKSLTDRGKVGAKNALLEDEKLFNLVTEKWLSYLNATTITT